MYFYFLYSVTVNLYLVSNLPTMLNSCSQIGCILYTVLNWLNHLKSLLNYCYLTKHCFLSHKLNQNFWE